MPVRAIHHMRRDDFPARGRRNSNAQPSAGGRAAVAAEQGSDLPEALPRGTHTKRVTGVCSMSFTTPSSVCLRQS